MANLNLFRGVLGLVLLFCSCASLFLGVMGICLLKVWTVSPWLCPPVWCGVTGLLAGMLRVATTHSSSLYLARCFVISCIITIFASCAGLGVLIAQLSTIARICESAQQESGINCSHKLIALSGCIFAAMVLVLLSALFGVYFYGGEKYKQRTIVRAPERGIAIVSTPNIDTHQILIPVTCQYVTKKSGRNSIIVVPWTLPSSTPSYSNRLSSAFNVSFNAGGSAFENRQSRYVSLD